MDCSPSGSSVNGDSSGKNLEWVATLHQEIFITGIKSMSPAAPALQVHSLPLSHQEAPSVFLVYVKEYIAMKGIL